MPSYVRPGIPKCARIRTLSEKNKNRYLIGSKISIIGEEDRYRVDTQGINPFHQNLSMNHA